MLLRELRISNLRCIEAACLELGPEDNYVFGPNGAGKTSILEAAYFLGRGRSFRTHRAQRLVRGGAGCFEVVGHVRWVEHDVVLGVRGGPGGIEARVGGEPAGGLADLAERLPVQIIDPESHKLVEEGPGHRRRFVDWGVFHVKPRFLGAWRQFRRALKQRNAALRQPGADPDTWNPALFAAAQQITEMRREYIQKLAAGLTAAAQHLLGQNASVEYTPGWPADLDLPAATAANAQRDRQRGITHAGPHRADLRIRLDGSPARDRVSRGQQKLLAAALILAQLDVLQDATGRSGLLLLDDPAAELDAGALERLMGRVAVMGTQRLVTGLDSRGLAPSGCARSFAVSAGKVVKLV